MVSQRKIWLRIISTHLTHLVQASGIQLNRTSSKPCKFLLLADALDIFSAKKLSFFPFSAFSWLPIFGGLSVFRSSQHRIMVQGCLRRLPILSVAASIAMFKSWKVGLIFGDANSVKSHSSACWINDRVSATQSFASMLMVTCGGRRNCTVPHPWGTVFLKLQEVALWPATSPYKKIPCT